MQVNKLHLNCGTEGGYPGGIQRVKVRPESNSPFSSSRDTTVQNLDFTRQTTDITHFAVVFHYDVISI